MARAEKLRTELQAARAELGRLEQRSLGMEQEIRDTIRNNAVGQGPRQSVTALRYLQAELPYLIEAAREKLHRSELALLAEEMRISEQRSREIDA